MASQERQAPDDLSALQGLVDHPEEYNFFQALRLIEACFDNPRVWANPSVRVRTGCA